MDFTTTNDRVRHLVAHSDGVSRTELAAALGLPTPTVTSAVRRLLTDATIVETEQDGPRSVAGRRPHLLFVSGRRPNIGVIVWQRTELHLLIADYGGNVRHRLTRAAPKLTVDSTMFAESIDELCRNAKAIRPRCELNAVVISVPAPFQQGVGTPGPRLSVRRRNTRAAAGVEPGSPTFYASLAADPGATLTERFGVKVYLENNANLAALGEFSAGAGQGQPDQMFVLLSGHSIGSGLVVGGRLVRGATGYAGELAHVQVDEDGPLCACGGRGCLSTRLGSRLIESVQPAYAQSITFEDLLAMAARGDAGPSRILYDIGRVVGRPLADVCTVLNPGLIVVDGRLGAASSFVVDGLREQIERFTPPAIGSSIEIVAGQLTDDAAVYGAIHLARVS